MGRDSTDADEVRGQTGARGRQARPEGLAHVDRRTRQEDQASAKGRTRGEAPGRAGQRADEKPPPEERGAGRQDRKRPRETRLQIAVTWLSGLLLLSVVSYLVWEGTRPFTPAGFTAHIEEVREYEGSYFVRLEVGNVGGQSVQSLGVVLELRQGEEVVETAEGMLDWLPERSSRELVLIVQRDPQRFTPAVTFEAYQIP